MIWEIGALKLLAKNATVPGVALKDAIDELERTQAKLELTKKSQQELRDRAERAEAENSIMRDALSTIQALSDNRDGYATAEGLGGLVDELHEITKTAGGKLAALAAHEKGGEG